LIMIIVLLSLCACGERNSPVPVSKYTPTPTPIISSTKMLTPILQTEFTEEQQQWLETEINLSDAQQMRLREVLEKPVVFQYEEFFELEEAFAAYEAEDFSECTSTNIVQNRVVDAKALLEQVRKNNAEYLVSGTYANKYRSYSDKELENLCNMVANTLNEKMKNLAVKATYLDRTLSNLKIFQYDSWVTVTYAAVQEEYILALSEIYISTLETEQAREKTVVHECMHLLQIGPSMDIIGVNHKSEKLFVNSLQNNWFYESSAEYAASQMNGEQVIYQNIMKSMDALMVATALEDEYVENYNFQYDLFDFYEMFSCDGLISRDEIAAAMYALDVFHYEQEELFGHYAEKSGTALDYKEQRKVKEKYQPDAYTVFSKKLFYDLGKQTITLEEAFDVMSVYETVCSNNLFYSDLYRMRPSLDFLERYAEMQDAYFSLLAELIGTTPENLRALYRFYYANEHIVLEQLDKKELLNYIYNKTEFNKDITVKEAYELYLQEGLPDGM